MFSDELVEILGNKKEEVKNINPLTEISESQMRLYGFSGAFNSAYFDSEELIE